MKDFCKLFDQICYGHNRWRVWTDFLEMSALSIANVFHRQEQLEAEYMAVVQRYEKKQLDIFPQLLGCVVNGLEKGYCDFLGTVFHELEMHNKYRGQFFTPYHLSLACARMSLIGMEEKQGVITVHEPACGSGSMVIACCEAAKEMGINYQYRMFFDAQDIDRNCFNMAYIQLALLAVPARVILGDTLRGTKDRWYFTPQYFLSGMNVDRLFRDKEQEAEPEQVFPEPIEINNQFVMFGGGQP